MLFGGNFHFALLLSYSSIYSEGKNLPQIMFSSSAGTFYRWSVMLFVLLGQALCLNRKIISLSLTPLRQVIKVYLVRFERGIFLNEQDPCMTYICSTGTYRPGMKP